jgi:hypothetical protein
MFTLLSFIFLGFIVALVVGLIRPFRYWPMSKTKPTRKRLGLTFGGFILICFILLGILSPHTKVADITIAVSPTPMPTKIAVAVAKPTDSPKKIIPTLIPTAKPISKPMPTSAPKPTQTPEQILQGVLDKYGKNNNDVLQQENGQWYLVKFTDATDDAQHAKAMSRNFIFDVYATKLPVRDVTINVGSFSDKNNFQESLCSNLANQQPQSTWTQDTQNDPFGENWYSFLSKHANTDPTDDCQTGAVNNI